MTKFRLVLVLLCLGILGLLPFVISQPKPDTAGDQRESTVQGQTPVQRQMAAHRAQREIDPVVGRQMEMTFYQAQHLAKAGKYKEALAEFDKLPAIPGAAALLHDKTVPMVRAIDEMRQFILARENGLTDRQTR